jgi:hypothetical protein
MFTMNEEKFYSQKEMARMACKDSSNKAVEMCHDLGKALLINL